jgi:hypothetical protein
VAATPAPPPEQSQAPAAQPEAPAWKKYLTK